MKIILMTATLLLIHTGMASAKVYTWTDENGQEHYSSQPPPKVKAKAREVEIKQYKTDHHAVERMNDIKSKANSARARSRAKSSQRRHNQEDAEENKRICERYKKRLDKYKREGVMGYNTLTGKTQKMTGQAKQEVIQNTQDTVDIFCK